MVHRPATFLQAALPIVFLTVVIVYGMVLRPLAFGQPSLPLEVVFPLASAFAVALLARMGHSWADIQTSIVARMGRGIPGFFILAAIGMLIGSWMVAGIIPMLVYWGIRLIAPEWLYLLAFLIPVIFSTLTGTSWGSAGTVGVVIMGVAMSVGADLAITAGAVVGGAYFGDKLSPLSDTTNMAALGADVDLFDHVRAMLWTTVPSALVAITVYTVVGLLYTPSGSATTAESAAFLAGLEQMYHFSPLLLIPPAVVLYGSLRQMPTIPVLGAGILSAAVLALLTQSFTLADVAASITTGFSATMAPWATDVPAGVASLVSRGGLYSMREAIFVAFLVFFFIGIIDRIDAMSIVVRRVFRFARTGTSTVLASLGATAVTNAMTSNQYATSFIVGDAFRTKYDEHGVPRRILSRSIEDYGTMLEPIVPWHPSCLFMVATLGVPVAEFWRWEVLTLANLVIAPLFVLLGIGFRRTR
ncbi:MAG: Na+/H+ antiporter NhaC [Acidimicrobiia bacterium]|nr:Na+/H+ antiporter NhaC [Acidimicrobiia bacterium]